jgi:Spy/CpxP family protein refolding chaperone
MFGFLIGTLSLVGFFKVLRWGRHGRHGGPRKWMLRRLYQHLDTTPGQEKEMAAATERVERAMWQAREQLLRSRGPLAKAMRAETFDTAALNEALDAQQASMDEARKALREGLQEVHEALSPQQRNQLGDLIEFGPARAHGCGHRGPRRHHHHAPSVSL